MKQRLAVFGSTGSIGTNTLELARRSPDQFEVVALTAGGNITLLKQQIAEFKPRVVVVREEKAAQELAAEISGVELLWGEKGLVDCAAWGDVDIACQGIMGFAALAPTLELVRRGKKIALANKETLVVAGELLQRELRSSNALCIPVDSEHNAIHQLLVGKDIKTVESLVLTASGGPFWRKPELNWDDVTPEMAVKHPNWSMGPKISVDSATLMNKGLEVVEAHFLFGFPLEKLEVWIHPQSIVHGAIWLEDGTCQAQLSRPDMKASIGYALAYPERLAGSVKKLSLKEFSQLEFAEPDAARFPLLDLPRQALRQGQSHLVTLNAANEIAVGAFLDKRLPFNKLSSVLVESLENHRGVALDSLEMIFDADRKARENTEEIIRRSSL